MIAFLTSHSPADWILVAAATAVATPAVAAAVALARVPERGLRRIAVAATGVAVAASLAVTVLWSTTDGTTIARGPRLGGGSLVHVDGLTAVLMPYASLIALAVVLVRPRRSIDPRSIARKLIGCSATLAMFLTAHPAALVIMWVVTALPTWHSTRATPGGRAAARVFAIAMASAAATVALGTALLIADPPWERSGGPLGAAGGWLVAIAVMIRKGIVPFHSWYPAIFAGAPMSTALAATMPQVAAYTAVRLLVGHADGVGTELVVLSNFAIVTAVYGAALAVVQRDLRGFIGFLAMSQSALTLAGLAGSLPMELTGALCVWISSGLALTGIGLVTWAIESRAGAISLEIPQGRFWDAPALASFFLLFGLATIGVPGTLSFVADDLIVSGALDERLGGGLMIVAATVLAAIAVIRAWFEVFGGPTAADSPRHEILPRERAALSALVLILFGFGLWPAPLVNSLDRAAEKLLRPIDSPPSLEKASSP